MNILTALSIIGKDSNVDLFNRVVVLTTGAFIASIGIEFFLVPNEIIDGGIVGLSIMGAHLTHIPLGIFLFLLNLPFIWLGLRRLGKLFAISSLFGVTIFSLLTGLFHPSTGATSDPILAAVFGGAIIGLGVGIVIRYGGTLDGTEIVAVLAGKKSIFSVGEVIMFLNLFILSSAGFVFGWDKAMYSLIAFFVAHKVIDATVEGLDESKSVWIVSEKYRDLGKAIEKELGRKVTYINGHSESSHIADGVMFSVITRIEEQKLKSIVKKYDRNAFVVISNVHEVMGKRFRKISKSNSKISI
ncbi:MAG TPA: YitT family protein [Patescibacteria group bacterium]|nr:YitT family protein [Patescibacteria group bacterium]